MKRNIHDISISITHDREVIVVAEPSTGIHGFAKTREEAIAKFWEVFYETGEFLASHQDELAPYLVEQLEHIRAVKAYEPHYQRREARASE